MSCRVGYSRLSQALLPKDIDRDEYRARQHEAPRPRQRHQITREQNAHPHQPDRVDLGLERNTVAVEIIADPWPEPWVLDQPLINTWGAAREACSGEQEKRRGGQDRQEDADHPQCHAEPADGQQDVAQHQGAVAYGIFHRPDLSGDVALGSPVFRRARGTADTARSGLPGSARSCRPSGWRPWRCLRIPAVRRTGRNRP
jgi:hypothetical protein